MTVKSTSREIDDRAAEWAARVDSGSINADDEARLNKWLAADTRHLGAYAKARAVALHTERARALGPDFDPDKFLKEQDLAAEPAPLLEQQQSRRRVLWLGGIAASAGAVALTGGAAWRLFAPRTYATQIGETRVVPLEDGSIVTLNTNSEVAVNFTKGRRDIKLIKGEALFDVAKNRQRPFTVDADGTSVRAVGTSFTVQLLPNQPVQVLVREGVVEVKRPDQPTAAPVRLPADTKAIAPRDGPIATQRIATAEVTRALSWRVGRLAFEGESLAQAAATFARYSDIKIIIDDPTVATETITGLYVSNDPVGFSKAVALSLDLRAEITDDEVHLKR